MRVLVDTNILLRSVQPNHPLCSQATHAVSKLIRQKDTVFFLLAKHRRILECRHASGRPERARIVARRGAARSRPIEKSLTLLPDVPAIYGAWKQIVSDHKVQGVKVYDARLVAIMSIYTVESVLTFNSVDSSASPTSARSTLLLCCLKPIL